MSQLRLLEDAFREFLNIEEKQEIPAVIQIREISTTLNIVGEATWKASIQCDEGRFVRMVEVKNPFNANDEENLEWYLEEFATTSPLSRSRAHEVSSNLKEYAAGLIKGFALEEVVNHIRAQNAVGEEPGITFFLDVETLPSESAKSSLHIIHWEVLENLDLWPREIKGRIVVRRKVADLELKQSSPVDLVNGAFNILLVVARNLSIGEDEIGHTLVAAELVKVLVDLPIETPVDLEIVRPGTWETFKAKLEARPRGYYRLVHFDLHGRVRVDKLAGEKASSLCFVSDKDPTGVTWKSASDVADLLYLHNVTSVILNARNSADASEESVALKFINRGVSAVVAVSYEFMASAAGSFMTGFYRSLLIDRSSFAVAAHAGRAKMMKQKMRDSSYGIRVPVEDHMVPVFYQRGELAAINWDVMRKLNMILLTNGLKAPMNLVGRELDILRLETLLLCGDGIAAVTGRRRVGKTALLKHLCWWWNITGLVNHSQYIDLEATQDTFCEILLLLYRDAIGMPTILEMEMIVVPDARETDAYWRLVNWLQLNHHLIVFDGVEHWKPEIPEKVQPADRTGPTFWNAQRRALESFLEDVSGGETIVIVTAELNSPWVDINPYALEGLSPYYMASLLPIELEKSNEETVLGPGANFMEFYAQLIELCDGLPGAVTEFSCKLPLNIKENTPEEVYCRSLLAVPAAAGRYSSDCARAEFVQSLIPPNSDEAPHSDLNRLIYIIAPFWGRIPKNIDDYLIFICFHGYFNRDDPKTLCLPIRRFDAKNPRDLSPEEIKRVMELLGRSKIRSEYHRITSSLQEKGYLTKDKFKPDQYYRVNPVLTLALRGVIFGDGHLSTVAHARACLAAFLDYYKIQTLKDNWGSRIQLEKTSIYSIMITLSCLPPTLSGLSLLPVRPMLSLISTYQAGRGGSDWHILDAISEMLINLFDSFLATERDIPLEAVFTAYKLVFHCSNYLCSRYRNADGATDKFIEQVKKSNEYSKLSEALPESLRENLLIANFMAATMSAQVADAHRELLPGAFVYETMGDVSGANREAHKLLESDPRIDFQAEGNSDAAQDFRRLQHLRTLSLEFDMKNVRGWSSKTEKAKAQKSIKEVCNELRGSAAKLGLDLTYIDGWLAVHEVRVGVITLTETLSKLAKAEANDPKYLPGSAIMEAEIKRDSGDIASAKEILLTALEHCREGGSAQGELLCHGRLQEIAYLTGQWGDTITHNERMIELVDIVYSRDTKEKRRADKAVLAAHSALAHIHLRQWDEAIECVLYTIRICQEAPVDDPNAFLLDRVQAEQLVILRYLRYHHPDHEDLPSSAEIRRQQLALQRKLDPAMAKKMDDPAVRRMEEIKTQLSLTVAMSPRAQWAAGREIWDSDVPMYDDGIPLHTRNWGVTEWWEDKEEDAEALALVKEYHDSFQYDPESALFGISLDESKALEGLLPGV
ncbi:unnamed protein product [Tuber melanosporum]|uniref:(Perigord truffle) hypothetical protein n=1 Tax=Tuber melanosporum (strain Mel28) TaxID=656061 RepID=D5GBA1_TUBMM|nr:uncharacterized protein GSTUM_00000535001 [Tuber melanosporum]CAZ81794.1 unnamed protein product [Tuber melanosporum]